MKVGKRNRKRKEENGEGKVRRGKRKDDRRKERLITRNRENYSTAICKDYQLFRF